ncbi:AAA family ATPase [Demequina maris]|uniref:AAA family ATPase n=1 Tax=Demequina maris TaxID=1638982 RepID=UPI00078398EA|nr:AAA family ATPase [Demequina maris]
MNKDEEIVNERAREEVYRRALDKKYASRVEISGAASFNWTGTGRTAKPVAPRGEVAGRVKLTHAPDAIPAGEYYVGTAHFEDDAITVFSWAAPIAATFYRESGHALCASVAGIRAFDRRDDTITNFEDTWRLAEPGTRLFAARTFSVPRAPSRPLPAPPRPLPPIVTPPAEEKPRLSHEGAVASSQPPRVSGIATPPPLRSGELLRSRLAAPRSERLGSVLSTLQAEQYNLVTRRGDEDLIIDGHPGTGKTIIAVHRAAYLVSEDYNKHTDDEATVHKVLLVGPTDEYVEHVSAAIDHLNQGHDHVRTVSLRRLLAMLSGLQEVPEGRAITALEDGDGHLWNLAHNAVSILKRRPTLVDRRSTKVRAAYEILRTNGELGRSVTRDDSWARYLRGLPTFERARTMRNHVPLLAALGWHVEKTRDFAGFDHFIVDEAQDVMEIEWALLDAINSTERWTLLGDMNQRRSDAALGNWRLVADALGLLDGANEAPVTSIRLGYRSTAPIMAFANRLLPKDQRTLDSIQAHGPEVGIERVREPLVHEQALAEADELLLAHVRGTVAIIGIEGAVTETVMRRQGWRKSPHHTHRWNKRGRSLDVLHPDHARGLEWDGVVVVEPARFPVNFLRHGLLYTSLTRANRELRVVHSQPLPEPLRGRGR